MRRPLVVSAVVAVVVLLSFALTNRAQVPPGGGEPPFVRRALFKVGATATVYLRGDVSGMSFTDRVPAEGFLLSRQGKIVEVEERWIILESDKGRHAIPLASVALVDVAPTP